MNSIATEATVLQPLRNGIPRILIVDDEPDLRELLELTVLKMGFDVESAETITRARELIGRMSISLCLTDMRLPDGDGLELVKLFADTLPATPIAVMTAFGSMETAVVALKAGAFDFLSKPVALDQLRAVIHSALRVRDAQPQSRTAAVAMQPSDRLVLGASPAMCEVRDTIGRLARSMAPVAIYGESGTGKEVAARAIHMASARASQPFIAVNCGAIPDALMEAEFFGYRKGAFTGAESDRFGFFQAADGGTLLLDEIAELPISMQVKLLRAIQERRVRKVGATAEEPVDVRIISATHRNLPERVAQGAFRQDLFYRLNVIELRMPPLRERREDIPMLAEAILARLAQVDGRASKRRLSDAALGALNSLAFPGNVRELENVLERACAFAADDIIQVSDLGLDAVVEGDIAQSIKASTEAKPVEDAQALSAADASLAAAYAAQAQWPTSLAAHLDAIERALLIRALEQTQFNRTAAAKLLGITFRQLRYRMQQLDIH